MDIERILSAAGSLASLIGLPLAINAAIPSNTNKTEISLKLFRGLTDVADRWKKVHNKYHTIYHDLRNLKAILDEYDNSNKMQFEIFSRKISGLAAIKSTRNDFKRDVDVYIGEIRTAIENEKEVSKKVSNIRTAIGDDYAIRAQFIFNAQKDAVDSHEEFCNLIVLLSKIYDASRDRSSGPDFENMVKIYNNFETFYDSYNRVILKTDEILLNTIDFFKLIAEAR